MTTEKFLKDLKIALAENVERYELVLSPIHEGIFTIYSDTSATYKIKIVVEKDILTGKNPTVAIHCNMISVKFDIDKIESVGYKEVEDKRILYLAMDNGKVTNIYLW